MDIDKSKRIEGLKADLIKKYNFFFDDPLDINCDTPYPENCRTIFQHITQLGRMTYEDHQSNISADFRHYPWRHEVRKRAERIVHRTIRCINTRQSEGGWRLSTEPEIMARFSVEVAW